jgi:RHS repeat-associated protein
VYNIDAAYRTTTITHSNAAGTTLSSYSYGYNAADWVTTETKASGTIAYSYDNTGQLTADGTHSYTYDLNGNRTQEDTRLYQTGTGNRVTSDGTWTYTYDAEGNLVHKRNISSGDLWTYTYDNLNRLTNASGPVNGNPFSVTYVYDVEGHRVKQIEQGTETRFAYDGEQVWADLDTSNHVLVRYLYGVEVDDILTRTQVSGTTATVTAYLRDRLGSVRDLLQFNTQTIVDHLDYDGFGNATQTATVMSDRYQFTAREFDANTGLQYNRARYYDPATGRWLSEDPLGFGAGDPNLYRYVRNDATNASDPSGLQIPPLPTRFGEYTVQLAGTTLGVLNVQEAPNKQGIMADFSTSPGTIKDAIATLNTKLPRGKQIDHFNWFQIGVAHTNDPRKQPRSPIFPEAGIPGRPFCDPPSGGTVVVRPPGPGDLFPRVPPFHRGDKDPKRNWSDHLPWYYDEYPPRGPHVKNSYYWRGMGGLQWSTTDRNVHFEDYPNVPDVKITFTTWLVGVDKVGNNPVFITGFQWEYDSTNPNIVSPAPIGGYRGPIQHTPPLPVWECVTSSFDPVGAPIQAPVTVAPK